MVVRPASARSPGNSYQTASWNAAPALPSLLSFCSLTAQCPLTASLALPRARASGLRGRICNAGSKALPADFGSAGRQWNLGSFLWRLQGCPRHSFCRSCAVPTRKKAHRRDDDYSSPGFPLLSYPVSVYPHICPMRCSEQLIVLLGIQF